MNKSSCFRTIALALPLVLGAFAAPAQLQTPDVLVDDPAIPAGLPGSALPEPRVLSSSLPAVVERGPHHAVIQTTKQIQWADGRVEWATNSYTTLATGLNYWDGQAWQPTEASFRISPQGAVAQKLPHQVILAPNANTADAVDLLLPDGQRMVSHVLGLSYYDAATARSVMVAAIQDSQGVLVAADQLVYPDSFTDLKADLRYKLSLAGLEQDVLIYENPPAPALFGLDPKTTRLEILTEMVQSPVPQITQTVLKQELDPQARGRMAEPDLVDDRLDFGSMTMNAGRAFEINEITLGAPGEDFAPVAKHWETIDNRTILFESVDWPSITGLLDGLPAAKQAGLNKKDKTRVVASRKELLPTTLTVKARTNAVQVAQLVPPKKAVILDYLIAASSSNFTFRGDTTYFVTNAVYLTGQTTIEGGTVIKSDRFLNPGVSTNYDLGIWIYGGTLNCLTTTYRPAIFTAKDDDSVGETISGSTGTPTDSYAYRGIMIQSPTAATDLHDVRFNFTAYGYTLSYGGTFDPPNVVRNCQFVYNGTGLAIYNSTVAARNVLLYSNYYCPISTGWSVFTGEHLTLDASYTLFGGGNPGSTYYFTNCLITEIGTIGNGTYSGSGNQWPASGTVVYQTVGAGAHYLSAGSPYRNAGATTINAALAQELKTRTTYPPIILTNDFTVNTTLAPQAQRDTDTPDLGWHYAPLDYMWTTLNLDAATLILTNGVAIANYGSQGTILKANANFYSEGSPVNMNRMVRPYAVQELPVLLGSPWSARWFFECYYYWQPTQMRFRFTEFSLNAEENYKHHLILIYSAADIPVTLSFTDCQFRNFWNEWSVSASDAASHTVSLTNNLWEYGLLSNYQDASSANAYTVNCYNNTFHSGYLGFFYNTNSTTWTVKDNLFDGTTPSGGSYSFANSNNGYTTGVGVLPGGSNNKTGLVADYQTGSLGGYYFPTTGSSTSFTNLLNSGSRLASAAGLYHYTTTTNNVKEASSTVDIGFHSVAVDASGQPIDTDGDGLPDYFEDGDGDSVVDSGETDWSSATDFGLKVWITQPKNNSILP